MNTMIKVVGNIEMSLPNRGLARWELESLGRGLNALLHRVSDPVWGIWEALTLDDVRRVVKSYNIARELTKSEMEAISIAAFAVAYKRRRISGGITPSQAKTLLVIAENRGHAECPGVGTSIVTRFNPDEHAGWFYRMCEDGSVRYTSGTERTIVTVDRGGSWTGVHKAWYNEPVDGLGSGISSESLARWLRAGCPMWDIEEDDEVGGLQSFHKGRRW